MECLVTVLEPMQDLDCLVHGGLAHQHGLEPALERRIALDVLAVLVERRRADDVHLSARQSRLEHVARVHRSFGGAGAHERVQLVDEKDDVAFVLGDLVDHVLQPLLELAAVLRACHHPGEIELYDATSGQCLGNLVVDDALRDALDDRRLADPGIADQRGVVLRAPREDLYRLLDFIGTADDRVELALAGHVGEVATVLVQRRCLARFTRGAALLDAPNYRAPKFRMRDAKALQELAGPALLVPSQRQEHVLRADVGRAELT